MHQCYFELQIYEDLIYGELEPVRLYGDKMNLGINYLNEEIDTCLDMQIVKVKVKNDDVKILEKLNISNAHPLANKYFSQRDLAFDDEIEELLSKKIAKELDFNANKVQFTVTKAKNNIQYIGVCEDSSWSKIETPRLKYCYYHQVLADCRKKLQRTLNLKAYEMEEPQFQKLISNVQKTLMFYIKELKKLHDINPKSLNYQVKESYNNQDCIALIYISLIEVFNFLYENFPSEFDKTYPVPYYSEKININQVNHKIKLVQKHFKEHEIDPLLKNILDEQFERIIQYEHPNRLTYHELDYFIELLNRLTKHFTIFNNQSITTNNIVSLLISFKFNNYKFIQYVISELEKDLNSINDLKEKRIHLFSEKTIIEQSVEAYNKAYDPDSTDISIVLCKWIEKGIDLMDEYIKNSHKKSEVQQDESYKLMTSLSTRELSVLIKTLSDCDIILSKSQSDLARWICANFRNNKTENISINQARNQLYNKDPYVLEKVKELAIEIVNVINEKLADND